MAQEEIMKLLGNNKKLFATEIINELKVNDEPKEFVRRVLKQMRKYHDVKFICVGINEITNNGRIFDVEFCNGVKKIIKDEILYTKFPELKDKRITRSCYLYYLKD